MGADISFLMQLQFVLAVKLYISYFIPNPS